MKRKERFVHVFYLDTVSLSNRQLGSTETQNQKLETLFQFITESKIRKKVESSAITSHTGDGVVICFTNSPRLPFELAIDLHRKLNQYNSKKKENEKIFVRIGINSGLIFTTKGVGGRDNYWGRGLIYAQRVMNAGDASHILLSANIAQELMDVSDEYKQNIRYIGNIKIKHDEFIPVYSASGNDFGNKNTPESFKKQHTQESDEEYGRLIVEELKQNEINPKKLLELLKQSKQSKLSLSNKKRRKQ